MFNTLNLIVAPRPLNLAPSLVGAETPTRLEVAPRLVENTPLIKLQKFQWGLRPHAAPPLAVKPAVNLVKGIVTREEIKRVKRVMSMAIEGEEGKAMRHRAIESLKKVRRKH